MNGVRALEYTESDEMAVFKQMNGVRALNTQSQTKWLLPSLDLIYINKTGHQV
jgi:hypothetical protein